MANVAPMEIGLVIWAEGTAEETLKQVADYGLRVIQLGIPPAVDCKAAVAEWKSALAESPVVITSAVCCYEGEDYSDLAKVHDTVGFTSLRYRAERIARTKEIAAFASLFGINAVSCHIGFIPSDPAEPLYADMVALAREICDALASAGQSFVLETGQESSEVLLQFIADVARPNLKINFDPANLIIYGLDDPLQALSLLRQHVVSIHCKDSIAPAGSGQMGKECRLGDGEVDLPGFLRLLQEIGYTGPLAIEREEPNREQKVADVFTAIERLKGWKKELGL